MDATPQPFTMLREARLRAGYTTHESLSTVTRLSVPYLNQLELGRLGMRWPTCVLLAQVLEIDPQALWLAKPKPVPYSSSRTAKRAEAA